VLGLSLVKAEATGGPIPLNITEFVLPEFKVPKSSEIKLNNDNALALHNFTVIQVASGKKMLTIRKFNPGQSVNLAFDREGTYVICYSTDPGSLETRSTCLQISVVGLMPV